MSSSSSSGPSQRHSSISSLVYSTLGPGLSLLPQEKTVENDWTVLGAESSTKHTEGDAERRGQKSDPKETSRPSRSSTASAGDIDCEVVEEPKQNEGENVSEILSRLYRDPNKREKKLKKRLGFNSKSGAGSVSSSEHAILSKQDSEDVFYPVGVSKQLKQQMSKSSIHEETEREASTDNGDASSSRRELRKISSGLGFIPRAPTGRDWGGASVGGRESLGLQEILEDLDREAGERKHRERVSSLQNDSMIGKGVSWDEDAISNRHLWQVVDSREACHLAESQYCQQLKVFHPRRQKVRCSSCRLLVHDTCIKQLYYEGYCCRDSFREIKQKVKETVTFHHFLHRRKAGGRCRKCERGFGNWKKFNGRDIVGVSCSWCGDSYHVACFSESLKKDLCHLGPLRNLIIPPSWIVKVPAVEQFSSGAAYSGSNEAHISPKGSARRKTRRSRRKKEDKASRFFTVKPIAQRQHKPLLVFINPKSGGNQGAKLMQTFQWLLNPRQVFDLSQGGPEFGLKLYQNLSNFRVLACGGDGTAGWIFSILDKLDIKPPPPLAILPLGTGNDLARVFNWGSGYADEPIDKILLHVEEGDIESMDRWQLNVWENPRATGESDGAEDTPLHVINNYFSIGCDAQVSLEFHLEREANPEKFNKRYKNKLQYGMLGGKDIFLRRFQTLTDHIQLYGDGEDLTERIRSLRLESICFLNISSYAAGADAWGTPSARDPIFKPQLMNDGKIEIVGFWASTMPKLKVGLAHGERIAQCQHIKLVMDRSFPVQIDGEACKLKPSVIEVALKNKAAIVRRVTRARPEAPLQGVRDSIKLSVSKVTLEQYDAMNSEPQDLRKAAKPMGLVIATSQDNLSVVRKQIEQINREIDEDGEPRLGKEWRFLDMANSGRVDRMFQVTPDQEINLVIGDMLSDGLLIVELPPPSVTTPMSQACMIMTPDLPGEGGDEASPETEMVGRFDVAATKRKSFGRNPSYEIATRLSPPVSSTILSEEGVANNGLLTVTTGTVAVRIDSSPSDDDLVPLAPFLKLVDTGSDSAGGSDEATLTSVQKELVDAVKRGYLEVVKQSHQKGGKLTLADSCGMTPLHYAARLNKLDIVEYIIQNVPKEALDIVDEEKLQTALHKAAWYGYVEVSKILVESGASLNRLDYQGSNVVDKAVQSGIKELQEYLEGKLRASKAVTSENELAI